MKVKESPQASVLVVSAPYSVVTLYRVNKRIRQNTIPYI